MRTNIDLDDSLMDRAREHATATTETGIVEEALATFVAVREKEARLARYMAEVAEIETRTAGLDLPDSLEILRQAREPQNDPPGSG